MPGPGVTETIGIMKSRNDDGWNAVLDLVAIVIIWMKKMQAGAGAIYKHDLLDCSGSGHYAVCCTEHGHDY